MKNISTANTTTNETAMTFEELDKEMKALMKKSKPLPEWKFIRSELVPFGDVWPVKKVPHVGTTLTSIEPCDMEEADYLMISTDTLNHYTKEGV